MSLVGLTTPSKPLPSGRARTEHTPNALSSPPSVVVGLGKLALAGERSCQDGTGAPGCAAPATPHQPKLPSATSMASNLDLLTLVAVSESRVTPDAITESTGSAGSPVPPPSGLVAAVPPPAAFTAPPPTFKRRRLRRALQPPRLDEHDATSGDNHQVGTAGVDPATAADAALFVQSLSPISLSYASVAPEPAAFGSSRSPSTAARAGVAYGSPPAAAMHHVAAAGGAGSGAGAGLPAPSSAKSRTSTPRGGSAAGGTPGGAVSMKRGSPTAASPTAPTPSTPRSARAASAPVTKGPWTTPEDRLLTQLVQQHGPCKWRLIADHMVGRVAKQCRERWHHHLCPGIKKTPWSKEEDDTIIRLQASLGNKWALIARHLPGRTDNSVKNRWNSSLAKRR